MNVLVNVTQDTATEMVRGLALGLADRQQLNASAAAAMAVPIQRNFLRLAQTNHNPFGVKSTFWALMNAGTYADADETSGWVATPAPVALRYFGGTVYPGPGKANLSIPARSEAYGKSPRDFPDLHFIMFGKGGAKALVQNEQQAIRYRKTKGGTKVVKGPESGGLVFFWLVPSATIAPDPAVLPDKTVLINAALGGVRGYVGHLALSS